MGSLVDRRANAIQVPLVFVGGLLVLVLGRKLPSVTPPLDEIPLEYVSPALYDWSTVQFGIALVVLGLFLTDRSVFQRVRMLRPSPVSRLAAFGCALALTSPWLVAIVVGSVVGFGEPFTTLWSLAFVAGWFGFAGLVVLGIRRFARLYLDRTDQFPYARVDATRREAIKGGAFAITGGGALVTAFAAGRVNIGESWPAYHGNAPVRYEHEHLRMTVASDSIRLGESFAVEITNTSETEAVSLGCHTPWALQSSEDGAWHHVTWTAGRYHQLCLSQLGPGETTTVTIPLSADAMREPENGVEPPGRPLEPGTYRLVLLGTNPYLAVHVQILPAS